MAADVDCHRQTGHMGGLLLNGDTQAGSGPAEALPVSYTHLIQVVFDSHQFSDAAGRLVHFFLRSAAVFQRKGDIFRHRQADELAVRILQHGADMIRQLKNATVGRIHAVYCQAACTLTGVGEGIQAIDASCQ